MKTQKDVWGITLTNTWDAADRLTKVEDSKGGTREYTYNDVNLATTMTYSDGSSQLRVDYTYSVRDQVTGIKRYTDTAAATLESETVYGYDDAGKATSITHKNAGGTTVDSFNYTYNAAGQITLETSTLGPTNTYTYDRTDQVTGDGTESFAWDANGNASGGGNTVTTGNRLTSDSTWTYTHDDAGNVIEKAKSGEYWFYGYDHNNRLTHLEKRTTEGGSSVLSVDFKYNIFGDRIERDYDADGAGAGAAVVLKMAYEAGNAWADMDSGLTVSTRHVYDGGLDSLVARIASGSQEDWYLTDVIGSVRDLVNGSGTLIDHIDYSVFGTPTETQPTNGDRYKFTGREWEAEAQIQYNRARYLQYGRWMSQDPMGFDAGDSNLYRYVFNTPIFSLDPSGTEVIFDRRTQVLKGDLPSAKFKGNMSKWFSEEFSKIENLNLKHVSKLWIDRTVTSISHRVVDLRTSKNTGVDNIQIAAEIEFLSFLVSDYNTRFVDGNAGPNPGTLPKDELVSQAQRLFDQKLHWDLRILLDAYSLYFGQQGIGRELPSAFKTLREKVTPNHALQSPQPWEDPMVGLALGGALWLRAASGAAAGVDQAMSPPGTTSGAISSAPNSGGGPQHSLPPLNADNAPWGPGGTIQIIDAGNGYIIIHQPPPPPPAPRP